jgi:GntR family transcriptional regulator / MocR family aminotransferase
LREPFSGLVDLDQGLTEPLHLQLTRQIKRAVLAGKLPHGTRVPSSRAMAAELGISRNTALAALDQLKAEGYLEARQGSGTRIAAVSKADFGGRSGKTQVPVPFKHRVAAHWTRALANHHQPTPDLPQPFRPGVPDVKAFPYDLWNASLHRASRCLDERAAGYGDISGHPRLRAVLAAHLAETRGVIADPDQILIASSARGATSLIASALLEPGDCVWMEEPGFRGPKTVFDAAGARLVAVPVDEHGIMLANTGSLPRPRLIYATPSHQYPTGAIMKLSRRLDLLDVAAKANAYIIEDDYDSEFQYRGRPIAALQGLDRVGCVLYVGTFSKSLLPSLRIGFAVAPPVLAPLLAQVHRNTGQFVPPVVQLAAADFIECGHYRAHVRRMRTLYAKRLDAFAESIAVLSGGRLRASIPDGGMQTVVTVADTLVLACNGGTRPPHPVLLSKGRRDAAAPSSLGERAVPSSPSPLGERVVSASPSPQGERAGVRGDTLTTACMDDRNLAALLSRAGIDCQPLRDFHLEPEKAVHRGVLMGFSAWSEDDAQRVLEKLPSTLPKVAGLERKL